jgi:enoyl-CoA hydratase
MVTLSSENGLDTLTLSNPPANALDLEFMEAILGGFDKAEASEARALIVTGERNVFSAGADLFRVIEVGRDYIERAGAVMSSVFRRLFTFPKPTVAAVNGHAIAGGSVLVCACDYRVASEGDYRLGFSELAVGVPFPAWALEILRFAVGASHVRELTLMARTVSVDEALRLGIVDEIVPPELLIETAERAAARLARVPADTYRLTKGALLAPAVERVTRLGDEHDREVADLWSSDEVHEAIREFLRRTVGKDHR